MNKPVSPEEALIFVMVMASAVDNAMAEKELVRIGQLIDILPVFENFDKEHLIEVSQRCATLLSGPEGLDIMLETIRDALPDWLHETAYALAVEIAAVDLSLRAEELRLLEYSQRLAGKGRASGDTASDMANPLAPPRADG